LFWSNNSETLCPIMLSFSSIYLYFLVHPLLIAWIDLILFVCVCVCVCVYFLRFLMVYHLRFLVLQIPLPMFDKFVLIILQVLTLYSPTHLKLHSHLQSLKLHLRLWIHLYINPHAFVSLQSYQILFILVIHHILSF